MFNATKWLQDCMHSVELKWHTNEQVQWPGGGRVNVHIRYHVSGNGPDSVLETSGAIYRNN